MAKQDYLRTSSLDIEGNLNFRKLEERKRYNDWLLGDGLRAELGHEIVSSNPHSRPPSWTQHHTNHSHAFVIAAHSSSYHEKDVLNAYHSGSVPLERTAVPASASSPYTKRTTLHKAIYKLTASAATTGGATHADTFVSGLGARYSGSVWQPASFTLNVPDDGRIIDVKVWLEVLHTSASICPDGQDDGTYDITGSASPLGTFVAAIRSPHVTNFFSFPIYNDDRVRNHPSLGMKTQGGPGGNKGTISNMTPGGAAVPSIFCNSFLLWVGRSGSDEEKISTWQKDRHMRTVFWDSSPQFNPGHLDQLYAATGRSNNNFASNATGAPSGVYMGNDFPWITDVRDPDPGAGTLLAAGSPPQGWLTGPGGSADVLEFDTTGSNLGPATIRPYYPLLPAILEVQEDPTFASVATIHGLQGRRNKWQGTRPGLRGTEMKGTWELLLSTTPVVHGKPGNNQDKSTLIDEPPWGAVTGYFRQWRLEITYEKNRDLDLGKHRQRFSRPGESLRNRRRLAIVSGSNSFTPGSRDKKTYIEFATDFKDITENFVYELTTGNPHGRTSGITDNTGSLVSRDEFAVFTRITGSLLTRMSSSLGAMHAFLHNRFGTPFIPDSSGSGDPPRELMNDASGARSLVSDVMFPKTDRQGPQTREAFAAQERQGNRSARDIVRERTSGSL